MAGDELVMAHLTGGMRPVDIAQHRGALTIINYRDNPQIYNRQLRKLECPFIERLTPSPAEPLREQAAALLAEGKQEEALACLVQASQLDPKNEATRLDGIEILLARCHAAGLRLLGLGGFAVQVIIAALLYYRIALLRFHYLGVRGVGLIHDFLLVAVIV